ncbi:MAG: hypothetical protein KDE31_24300, partial [Caldilineaceae bacterium]|nr:hypothetical protein [Caldilineaceae bacterium]
GYKVIDGNVTDIPAIRIYVTQKLAASLLSPAAMLPTSVNGIPTDVIEAPPAMITVADAVLPAVVKTVSCTDDRQKRQRPVVAGISTGHFNVTAGTIGYFCRSTRKGDDPEKVYVLSNNHVFANVNQGNPGDALYQPGSADGGTAADRFARLHRFANIALGGSISNQVDAAIGELLPDVDYQARICRIGKVSGTAQAVQNMTVRKHGRTSGYTRGRITDLSVDTLVSVDRSDPSVVALFTNQMRIERVRPYAAFGLGGDSGSLVVSAPKSKAVGLYFAGPADGSYGLANHIGDVLKALEIELV